MLGSPYGGVYYVPNSKITAASSSIQLGSLAYHQNYRQQCHLCQLICCTGERAHDTATPELQVRCEIWAIDGHPIKQDNFSLLSPIIEPEIFLEFLELTEEQMTRLRPLLPPPAVEFSVFSFTVLSPDGMSGRRLRHPYRIDLQLIRSWWRTCQTSHFHVDSRS